MKNVNKKLDLSANLIKSWGEIIVFENVKLSEYLTIKEIKFWDIFAVEMARIYLPELMNVGIKNRLYFSFKIILLSFRLKYQIYFNLFISIFRIRKFFYIKQNSNKKKNILLLGFQHYIYKDTIEPLIFNMDQFNEQYNPVLVSDSNYQISEKLKKINRINLNNYFDASVACELKNILEEINKRSTFLFNNKFLDMLIDERFECDNAKLLFFFKRLFFVEMPKIAYQALLAKRIINDISPAVIVSPDVADQRNRIFVNYGKLDKIPTLDIQFGLTQDEGIEWRFCNSDFIAAWGENSQKELIKHGVNNNSIIITGSPRHDELCTPSVKNKNNDNVTILMASTYNLKSYSELYRPDALLEMMYSVIEAVSSAANIKLIIKPHPRERENDIEFKKYIADKDNITVVSKDSDIREYIKSCDVFISFGTTATADALICNKIVICPVFTGWIWSEIFTSTGAVIIASDKDSLIYLIEKISKGVFSQSDEIISNRENFIKNYAYAADGNSSSRVMDLIEYMDSTRS
jgi:hypothetical protein